MKKHFQAFLSCSFKEQDKEINNFIDAICKGFGFITQNLNHASSATPAAVVNRLISYSNCLIAVCTKRDQISNSHLFKMPQSVSDEIAFAYSLKKPMLIIFDDEVDLSGFITSEATLIPYKTNRYRDTDFISGLITSFLNLITTIKNNKINKSLSGTYFNEEFTNLISLESTRNGYSWSVTATKLLKFTQKLNNEEILTRVWPSVPVTYPETAPNGSYEIIIHDSSKEFRIDKSVQLIKPDHLTLGLNINPDPEKNDFIKFTRKFTSPYINPIDMKAVSPGFIPINIQGKKYFAFDGIVPAEATKKLILKFVFPDFSGIREQDISLMVANHGVGFININEEEFKRTSFEIQQFGRNIFVNMEVDFPLLNCFYGIAWIPPNDIIS